MAAEELISLGLKPWAIQELDKNEAFWFEKLHDGNELRLWSRKQLPVIALICAIYYIFISAGPLWMKNRKPLKLKNSLFVWNALLAIFSIFGSIRTIPELFRVLSLPDGFYQSACVMEGQGHYPTSFWGFLFALSKIVELGDTVFLVLRKKPIIFLHWYHHITMCWFTFYMYSEGDGVNRYVGSVNYFIHSIMYTYYAAKAIGVKIPKPVSVMITSFQILQFIVSLYVNCFTVYVSATGGECSRSLSSTVIIFIFTVTYTYLFSSLFYHSYVAKPKSKSK